jgi:hypothetical protein
MTTGVVVASNEVRFLQWRPARASGGAWRQIVDVERGEQHLGEVEACLSADAANALAAHLDRELSQPELVDALRAYVEGHVCALLERGQDLSVRSLIIEIDRDHRELLLPYLRDARDPSRP